MEPGPSEHGYPGWDIPSGVGRGGNGNERSVLEEGEARSDTRTTPPQERSDLESDMGSLFPSPVDVPIPSSPSLPIKAPSSPLFSLQVPSRNSPIDRVARSYRCPRAPKGSTITQVTASLIIPAAGVVMRGELPKRRGELVWLQWVRLRETVIAKWPAL